MTCLPQFCMFSLGGEAWCYNSFLGVGLWDWHVDLLMGLSWQHSMIFSLVVAMFMAPGHCCKRCGFKSWVTQNHSRAFCAKFWKL